MCEDNNVELRQPGEYRSADGPTRHGSTVSVAAYAA